MKIYKRYLPFYDSFYHYYHGQTGWFTYHGLYNNDDLHLGYWYQNNKKGFWLRNF